MSRLKAAIIDDGAADVLFENARSVTVSEDLRLNEDASFANELSHSSVCMSIIKKYADISGVEWLNINIMNSRNNSGVDCFIKALEYCRINNVKLIHLSIGSRNFKDFMRLKVEAELLIRNGTVIVAALSNQGDYTVPACLDGVIGVGFSADLKDNELYYLHDDPRNINFIASSRHLLRFKGKLDYTSISSSYAAPVVTAAAINVLKSEPFLDTAQVIERIKTRSKREFVPFGKNGPFLFSNAYMLVVPVVLVKLSDIELQSRIVKELKELFLQYGYNAFCSCSITDSESSLLKNGLINYLLFIQRFYNSDIIILGYSDERLFSDLKSYDIIVSDDNGFKDTAAEFINYADAGNAESLFDMILDSLSEEKSNE